MSEGLTTSSIYRQLEAMIAARGTTPPDQIEELRANIKINQAELGKRYRAAKKKWQGWYAEGLPQSRHVSRLPCPCCGVQALNKADTRYKCRECGWGGIRI